MIDSRVHRAVDAEMAILPSVRERLVKLFPAPDARALHAALDPRMLAALVAQAVSSEVTIEMAARTIVRPLLERAVLLLVIKDRSLLTMAIRYDGVGVGGADDVLDETAINAAKQVRKQAPGEPLLRTWFVTVLLREAYDYRKLERRMDRYPEVGGEDGEHRVADFIRSIWADSEDDVDILALEAIGREPLEMRIGAELSTFPVGEREQIMRYLCDEYVEPDARERQAFHRGCTRMCFRLADEAQTIERRLRLLELMISVCPDRTLEEKVRAWIAAEIQLEEIAQVLAELGPQKAQVAASRLQIIAAAAGDTAAEEFLNAFLERFGDDENLR